MRFCLQLVKLKHISHEEFKRLNWLPVTHRFKQFVNAIVFKYFNKQCPNYLNEVFDVAIENNFQLRGSFQKLKCPFRKTNTGQLTWSYTGPTFWNKTPDTLKHTKNINSLKHNLKTYFLNELKNCNNSLNLFWFPPIKNLQFHLCILILKVLLPTDHNVNTSFYKHVFCHAAKNRSVFHLC